MAFPPFYETIWIDEKLSVVKDVEILEGLEAPYQRAPNDGRHQDWNINSERWPSVSGLDMPVTKVWREWIPEVRDMAEQLLRKETALEDLCRDAIERSRESDEVRFAQLRARLHHAELESANETSALLARFAQLRSPTHYADPESANETSSLLAREERIAKSLHAAIREPRITLGTVLAVFVSPHPLPGLGSAHG